MKIDIELNNRKIKYDTTEDQIYFTLIDDLKIFVKNLPLWGKLKKPSIFKIKVFTKQAITKKLGFDFDGLLGYTQNGIINITNFNEAKRTYKSYLSIVEHEIMHSILFFNKNSDLCEWIEEGVSYLFSTPPRQLLKQFRTYSKTEKYVSIPYLESSFSNNIINYVFSAIYLSFLFEKHTSIFFELIVGNISVYDFECEAINFIKLLTKTE